SPKKCPRLSEIRLIKLFRFPTLTSLHKCNLGTRFKLLGVLISTGRMRCSMVLSHLPPGTPSLVRISACEGPRPRSTITREVQNTDPSPTRPSPRKNCDTACSSAPLHR